MAVATAGSKVRTIEPWLEGATVPEARAGMLDADGLLENCFGSDDDDGWSIEDDPEFMAELERRCDKYDAELAAGTLVTYMTDEVFEHLHKEFPQLFGVK